MRAGITVLATAFASTVASSVSWDIFGKVDKASASLSFWGGWYGRRAARGESCLQAAEVSH